jgi:hypothetical protein
MPALRLESCALPAACGLTMLPDPGALIGPDAPKRSVLFERRSISALGEIGRSSLLPTQIDLESSNTCNYLSANSESRFTI